MSIGLPPKYNKKTLSSISNDSKSPNRPDKEFTQLKGSKFTLMNTK